MKIKNILTAILASAFVVGAMTVSAMAQETGDKIIGYIDSDLGRIWGETRGSADTSYVVKAYAGDTLIASSSLNNVDGIIDGDVNVTWSIPTNGQDSDFWDVEWTAGHPNANAIPTTVELWIDGEKVSTGNVNMNAPDDLKPTTWGKTAGVYDNRFDSFGLVKDNRPGLRMDMFEINAVESVEFQLWSEDTKLSSTVYVSGGYKTAVGGYLSGTAATKGTYGSWDTEWFVTPSTLHVPTKAVLVIDGVVTDEMVFADVAALKNVITADTWLALEGVSGVVAIDGVEYATLQAAVDEATDGDKITFITDIAQTAGVLIEDKNLTIDLDGYTFTVSEGATTNNRNFLIKGDSVVIIENGTLVADGEYSSGTYGTVRTEGSADLTLKNLKLYNYRGNGLNIKALGGTTVSVIDTEIYSVYGGGIEAAGAEIELTNVTVEQKGMYTAPYNSMAISVNGGGTVTVYSGTYTTEPIEAADAYNQGTSHGSWAAGVLNSGGKLIIKGGTFKNGNYGDDSLATAARGLILADTGAVIEIEGGIFDALKGIVDIQNNLGDASKNPTGTISGGTFSANPTNNYVTIKSGYSVEEYDDGKFAVVENAKLDNNTIKVSFAKADVDNGTDNLEGEDVYNIILKADEDKVINRLNSADLTFLLTTDDTIAYEIIDIENDNISINSVNNSEDRYEFHFDTKTEVTNDTAKEIVIGQVKFTGYGDFTFGVDTSANDTNAAHATEALDNIVDTYIPNGDIANGEGKLDVSDSFTATILVPTRDLTINLTFPNAVENKSAAYQQMKVTVSGGDLDEAIVVELGSDAVMPVIATDVKPSAKVEVTADSVYQVVLTNALTADVAYNVEISGAGYRTTRYTVTMQGEDKDGKVLDFWNNVKDNALEVEEGKATSAKTVTYLAGDIVKDSLINIYDLSAVVSYFGEEMDTDEYNAYAKYDLNRDGKIDSKDVAYVLVSWGK